jgi:sortase A
MNRNEKKVASYFVMPLLYSFLCMVVIILAGLPVFNLLTSHVKMVLTKGAPGYANEFDPNMFETVARQNGMAEVSEIQIPALDTHYGNITCERIELEAPIYYGDSDNDLSDGVGHYTASALPGEGKPILIGGHDSTYFSSLEKVMVGDRMTITTNYGEFNYRVIETKVAESTDPSAYNLNQDKEQLILYTCYPFNQFIGERTERYFVYCDRVEE